MIKSASMKLEPVGFNELSKSVLTTTNKRSKQKLKFMKNFNEHISENESFHVVGDQRNSSDDSSVGNFERGSFGNER